MTGTARASLSPGSWTRPRTAGFAVLLILLGFTAVGCGNADVGPESAQTTRPVVTSIAEGGSAVATTTLRPEPTGPETAQPPPDRGIAISLGGPPSGRGGASGSFYNFSDEEPTWCVPLQSDTIYKLSTIPPGMSIGMTVTVTSRLANVFVASDSSQCQTPCDSYIFTTITWSCATGVTWNGQSTGGGGLDITLIAYCGTADESECREWATTNYNPDGVELAALGTGLPKTTAPTTSSEPTASTSTTTTTAGPTTSVSTPPLGPS